MSSKRDVSDEQNERHKRILSALVREEGNKYCVDCRTRNPTWASVNLGVFMCLTCSGIHRSLGVHISQVRSTNLDTWLPKQVDFVKSMGNVKGNKYWEASLPGSFRRPPGGEPNAELAKFIRDKYCDRRYAAKEVSAPNIENYLSHPYVQAEEPAAAAPISEPAPAPQQYRLQPSIASADAPARLRQEAPAPSIDLLGLDEPHTTPALATQAAATPAVEDPFAALDGGSKISGADWGDFASATAQTTTQATEARSSTDPFMFVDTGLAAAVQQVSISPQPAAASNTAKTMPAPKSADDILKLFNTPSSNAVVDPFLGPVAQGAPGNGNYFQGYGGPIAFPAQSNGTGLQATFPQGSYPQGSYPQQGQQAPMYYSQMQAPPPGYLAYAQPGAVPMQYTAYPQPGVFPQGTVGAPPQGAVGSMYDLGK